MTAFRIGCPLEPPFPKVAFCITAWNRGDLLAASLASLLTCLDDLDAGIWIIDNGSDLKTRRIIATIDCKNAKLFKVHLPINMGIPYALNLFGAAIGQESAFAGHSAPDHVVILDADMFFRRQLRELVDLLRDDPGITIVSGHDSVEHSATDARSIEGARPALTLKTKDVERGCFFVLRYRDFLEFLPLPHDVPYNIDWQMVRDHPRSLAKTGRKLVCVDASAHLGLFDSTWSTAPLPASAEQVEEIVGLLDRLDLLTADRRARIRSFLAETGLSLDLPNRRFWPGSPVRRRGRGPGRS